MLHGVHIFHTKQLTSMICNVPEIYGPVEADPWSESSASSESCPQTLVASTELPSFTLLYRECSLPVSGQAVFWGVTSLQRHHPSFVWSVSRARSHGREEAHKEQNQLCLLKGPPAVHGLRGACELLNSSLPPSRSCTARCWDKGRSLTSCRKQGKQQLLHLRGLMTRITSRPALSAILMVKALTGAHSLRSKQPFSSTAK